MTYCLTKRCSRARVRCLSYLLPTSRPLPHPRTLVASFAIPVLYTLIQTCKLNGINPEVYLADLIGCVGEHPVHRIDELLPWNWHLRPDARLAA